MHLSQQTFRFLAGLCMGAGVYGLITWSKHGTTMHIAAFLAIASGIYLYNRFCRRQEH